MLISLYIDKKNDEYKISLMQETMRLNNLSLEIYEKNKTITDKQTILMTDYALRQCSAKRLSSNERIELSTIITVQAKSQNLDPLLIISPIQVQITLNPYAQSHKWA